MSEGPPKQASILHGVTLSAGSNDQVHARAVADFERACEQPEDWLEQARSLHLAAQAVLASLEKIVDSPVPRGATAPFITAYVRGYMLLMGYAYENALKALEAANRGITLLAPNKRGQRRLDFRIKRGMAGHALVQPACRLGLSLAETELDWLRRLEHYTLWAGRYPFPLSLDAFLQSRSSALSRWSTIDKHVSDALFGKIVAEIARIQEQVSSQE